MSKVCVIGGGAAGMFAAIAAAQNGNQVCLYEKNEKLGKKLFITGKGRCNVTNACDTQDLFQNIIKNSKFMYSAIYGYDNWQVMNFFETHGVPLKTERGNRVFPVSDKSSDIISALQKELQRLKVEVRLRTTVERLEVKNHKVTGIVLNDGKKYAFDKIIVATGGISYPQTGSTGDGYRFATESGHKLVECEPSLVPFETKEEYVLELQGLSLKNVSLRFQQNNKILEEQFGEMLFTHFGVSGPMIISASATIGPRLKKGPIMMYLDLKPALSEEQLDARILRDFHENQNRQFKNSITGLFPAKLTPVMIELSGILPDKKVNEITREERMKFVHLIKNLQMTAIGLRGFHEAIITKGGVLVKDINPSTMESKIVQGLYFAGEVIDVDAFTGGYNLQIAWSTGYLAGISIQN